MSGRGVPISQRCRRVCRMNIRRRLSERNCSCGRKILHSRCAASSLQALAELTPVSGTRTQEHFSGSRRASRPGCLKKWACGLLRPWIRRRLEQDYYCSPTKRYAAVNTVDSRGMFRGGNPNSPSKPNRRVRWIRCRKSRNRTGGKAYIHRNDLDNAMEEGIEASRTSYTLGFYLTVADRGCDKFHALKVQTHRPRLQLFYRQGYYAKRAAARYAGFVQRLEPGSAVLNQVDSAAVLITASYRFRRSGYSARYRQSSP